MKIFRKITILTMVMLNIFSLTNAFITNTFITNTFADVLNSNNREVVNTAVLLYSFDDIFMQQVKQSLEDIQKENLDKVRFTFYDGKNNITVQNEILDTILKSNADVIIGNLVGINEIIVGDFISRVKAKNIPLVLLDIPPEVVAKVSNIYNRDAFVAPDSKGAGISQGKIIVDLWNTNKSILDKNNDNTLEYILLEGEAKSPTTIDRTKYSILEINDSGINTRMLARVNVNWSRKLAKSAMESLFFKYDGNIEAIISNNDAMAIGAIETLQKYGYNNGDKTKNITVVGIDAVPEAKSLIDRGFMMGTVVQDPKILAEVFYNVAMNLVQGMNPTENTNYNIVNGEIIIPYTYQQYTNMTSVS